MNRISSRSGRRRAVGAMHFLLVAAFLFSCLAGARADGLLFDARKGQWRESDLAALPDGSEFAESGKLWRVDDGVRHAVGDVADISELTSAATALGDYPDVPPSPSDWALLLDSDRHGVGHARLADAGAAPFAAYHGRVYRLETASGSVHPVATDTIVGRVRATKSRMAPALAELHLHGSEAGIVATPEHPFFVPARNEYVGVSDLRPGDELLTGNGEPAVVASVAPVSDGAPVYNFVVGPRHNYFVGAPGQHSTVLVHNSCWDRFIELLRQGKNIHAKSIDDARELLRRMRDLTPDTPYRKMPNPDGKMGDGFRQPRGTYRGDLINTRNPAGPIHTGIANESHAVNPHYNIKCADKTKATIVIDGQ